LSADDAEVQGRFERSDAKADFIAVPRDDDNIHVADHWELDHNVPIDAAATEDDDPIPTGQRRDGDGLTLYEDYRGFIAHTSASTGALKWIQTDPMKKDLFVYDENGLYERYVMKQASNPPGFETHTSTRRRCASKASTR